MNKLMLVATVGLYLCSAGDLRSQDGPFLELPGVGEVSFPPSGAGIGDRATIEAWVRAEVGTVGSLTIFRRSGYPESKVLAIGADDTISGDYQGAAQAGPRSAPGTFSRDGAWHHIALVRNPSSNTLFYDGVVQSSVYDFRGAYSANNATRVAISNVSQGAFSVDSVRASSVARYGATFTPERTWDVDSSTALLLEFNLNSGSDVFDASQRALRGSLIGSVNWMGGKTTAYQATEVLQGAIQGGISHHAVAPSPTGSAILFGGITSSGVSASTFELVSDAWQPIYSMTNPMPRERHCLVLDAAGGRNLLFGGANPIGAVLGDTWSISGGQWTLLSPSGGPVARKAHDMGYDSVSGDILMFGGLSSNGQALGDTWKWMGDNWVQLSPSTSPSPRYGHSMAYDERRGVMVLFGGHDGTALLGDTWEWSGQDWTQRLPRQPSGFTDWMPAARFDHGMIYDKHLERVVVLGGEVQDGCSKDAWSWDGEEWTRHYVAGLGVDQRLGHAMFHQSVGGGTLLLGGSCVGSSKPDMWRLNMPYVSRYASYGSGCSGTSGVPVLSAASTSRPVAGEAFSVELSNMPTSPASIPFVIAGFSRVRWPGGELPLDLAIIGMPGCSLLNSADDAATLSNQAGVASMSVVIPVSPALLGAMLYLQGAVLDRFANAQGIVMSNGIELRIGDI